MAKYAFISANGMSWGGSEFLWSRTAEKMARRGLEVRVSVPDFLESSEGAKWLREAGARVHCRRPPSLMLRAARRMFRMPGDVDGHMRSLTRNADLVVISQGCSIDGPEWIEWARAAGLRYAIVVQGAHEAWWLSDECAEQMARGFEAAVRTYFVSQATLDVCRRQFGIPFRNGSLVRNPFNVRYDARPGWPAAGEDELRLAAVGRMEVSTKGQDLLLDALALPHWRERNIRVSMVGSGPQQRALQRHAEALKLSNVRFVGHQSDIEHVWSEHHALVLPSRTEGMPLVLVEAMLCGRPCIATDVGGPRELIRDGVNGFLARAPMVEFIDEALSRAWENRHRLREMGERAASDVRQWTSADPVEDFVRELTSLVERTDVSRAVVGAPAREKAESAP